MHMGMGEFCVCSFTLETRLGSSAQGTEHLVGVEVY